MYQGVEGKIASVVSFIEEAGIFGTDLLPTFTLTWIYKYLIKKTGNILTNQKNQK